MKYIIFVSLFFIGCVRADYNCQKDLRNEIHNFQLNCLKDDHSMHNISRCQKETARIFGCQRKTYRVGNLGVIEYKEN